MSGTDQNIEQTSGRALKKIWRATEIKFAEKGFEGASMKACAIQFNSDPLPADAGSII